MTKRIPAPGDELRGGQSPIVHIAETADTGSVRALCAYEFPTYWLNWHTYESTRPCKRCAKKKENDR